LGIYTLKAAYTPYIGCTPKAATPLHRVHPDGCLNPYIGYTLKDASVKWHKGYPENTVKPFREVPEHTGLYFKNTVKCPPLH
jgi:hypothetical protein